MRKPPDVSWKKYLRTGIGRRLSILGEAIGSDALIYNRLHFWHFHDYGLANSPSVIRSILKEFPQANKWVDIGAGTGAYSAEFNRHGKQAIALERSPLGRKVAKTLGVDARVFDLTHDPVANLEGAFDGTICFEVAEHLPPDLGEKLVAFITSVAPLAIFTAAVPGQGGTDHINEQPREYWIERFKNQGFDLDTQGTEALRNGFVTEKVSAGYLITNLSVFRRKPIGGDIA